MLIEQASYWLAEHPTIVKFRWSHSQSWGATWPFLISSISIYILTSLLLHLLLHRFHPSPISLPLLPSLHSLAMSFLSATIFSGLLISSLAEIRDTRWLWLRRRRHLFPSTPLQWLLCFPLGTRPSGRVFFWSYLFYLSKFLHLFSTFFSVLSRRRLTFAAVSTHCINLCMSFLWLEFSQSFQVLAILATTFASFVVFGYRFWVGIGLPVSGGGGVPVVLACQVGLMACNLVFHVGVFLVHFCRGGGGGCNGIGAWCFNSLLNATLLVFFFHGYRKNSMMTLEKKKKQQQ